MKPTPDDVVHEVLVQWPKGHRTWMSVPGEGLKPAGLPAGAVVIEGRTRRADDREQPASNPAPRLELLP